MSVAVPKKKKIKTVKDAEKLLINYITGKLDLAQEFNTSRIVTHELNSVGRPIENFDSVAGVYFQSGPYIVTDNEGNVISIGSGAGATDYL